MFASYRIPAARIRADLARHHHKATAGLRPGGILTVLRNSAVCTFARHFSSQKPNKARIIIKHVLKVLLCPAGFSGFRRQEML
jgi:hypothetical protein